MPHTRPCCPPPPRASLRCRVNTFPPGETYHRTFDPRAFAEERSLHRQAYGLTPALLDRSSPPQAQAVLAGPRDAVKAYITDSHIGESLIDGSTPDRGGDER